MTPQILLYNITDEHKQKIKALILRLRIRARVIAPEQYTDPVGTLAGLGAGTILANTLPMPDVTESGFTDEMLVFCFLSDGVLNQFLAGLRKAGIAIPCKAVLTPSNCGWNSLALHQEISAEHKKMHGLES